MIQRQGSTSFPIQLIMPLRLHKGLLQLSVLLPARIPEGWPHFPEAYGLVPRLPKSSNRIGGRVHSSF